MVERLGAPAEDLQQEGRLRLIEKQLPVESFTTNPDDVSVEDSVPQVTGLSVAAGVRNLTFKWSDASIPQVEFDYYEIQISTSSSFPSSGLVIDRTQDLQYTFYEGDPETEYFARVRAVLNDGRTGDFSVTVNLTTGLAVAGDFEPESIIVPSVAFSSGSQSVAIAAGQVVVQTLTIAVTGVPVAILIAFEHTHTIAGSQARQPIRIARNGTTLVDFYAFISSTGFDVASFVVIDETPGTGTVSYTLEYDNNLAGVGNDALVSDRTIVAIELKK